MGFTYMGDDYFYCFYSIFFISYFFCFYFTGGIFPMEGFWVRLACCFYFGIVGFGGTVFG